MNKNQTIKVSIIVAIYNSAKFLDKLITSIINQSYKNIEVINAYSDSKTDIPMLKLAKNGFYVKGEKIIPTDI